MYPSDKQSAGYSFFVYKPVIISILLLHSTGDIICSLYYIGFRALTALMKKNELSPLQQKLLGLAAVGIAVVVFALLIWLVGVPLVRFASQPERFRDWVNSHGFSGRIAYMGMVILQVIVAVIPGEPFEIAAGYAFGAVEGTLLCLAASAMGSICVFLLVRRFGPRLVEVFFSKDKLRSVRFLQATPRRDLIFLIIFMLPGTPKDLLCYFAGLTNIRFPVWLMICSLGRIPSIVTSTMGGDALGSKNYWGAILIFAVTLIVSAGGMLIYDRLRARREREKDKPDTAQPSLSDGSQHDPRSIQQPHP